jgi:uncharacterized OB-fold protein
LAERITSVDQLKSWTDQIPLKYDYSAGVAGERFLRGLQQGKIVASVCERCGTRYLPPKMYCVDCFLQITKFDEVGPEGRVRAFTESYVDFDGRRSREPRMLAFVTFKGTEGGIIHRVNGRPKLGARVRPKFAPEKEKKGSLLDILAFEAV